MAPAHAPLVDQAYSGPGSQGVLSSSTVLSVLVNSCHAAWLVGVAEVIGYFAFDEDLEALRLQEMSDGSVQLAPQPFIQVMCHLVCCFAFSPGAQPCNAA